MRFLFFLLLVTFVAMVTVNALPVGTGNEVYEVNIRLIEESHSEQPVKRSVHGQAHNLPDHLVIGVPVDKNKADTILRLKRKPLIPMVTTDGRRYDSQKNASVYTDASRYSSMIVRRDEGQYSLQGTFHHGGKEWNIKPLAETSRSPFGHQLESLGPNDGDERFSHGSDFYKRLVGDAAKPEESTRHDKNISRHKRSSPTHHVIETSIIVDFEQFWEWSTYYSNEDLGLAMIQLQYTNIAEAINIRFESIRDEDIEVSFRGVFLSVMTHFSDDDFLEGLVVNNEIDGNTALSTLEDYIDLVADLPISDHYMLFTVFDLSEDEGHANQGSMCLPTSISINPYTRDGLTGWHAAHQLGHSLSAIDDTNLLCGNENQYVMSSLITVPVVSENTGNSWKFSPCSKDAIKFELGGLFCTLPASTSLSDVLPSIEPRERSRQSYDYGFQCGIYMQDVTSTFCEESQPDISSVCSHLECTVPGTDRCESIMPQEYTFCGVWMWCVKGNCVSMLSTTTATTVTSTTATTSTTTAITTTTTTTPETPGGTEHTKLWQCCPIMLRNRREWWECVKTALGRIFG